MAKQTLGLDPLIELLMARVLKFLPVDMASGIGAWTGRRRALKAIKLKRKWVARLHRNFERLEGITDPKARQRRILEHIEHIGRLYAEYPVLHKIASERLSIHGAEHLHGLTGPAIFVSAHTGHWELIAEVLRRHRIPVADLYDPIPNKVRLQLAMEVRRHFCPEEAGNRFIPASPSAVRELVGWLKNGGNLVLFIDEEKDGLVWSPALGRELPFAGNRALAARLAAKYRVPLIPLHIQRKTGANFEAVIDRPLYSQRFANSEQALGEALNYSLEGWLKEDYGHWYWLAQLELDKSFLR
ncbi:hypothetical protein WNY58_16075 [Neptuniibacter pectenicola]|uniref:KDO2-lipid IV(A) lauroyltransferase n=1 Tax=Neptuniibacter pectenicola TaxID=1806669 RepID=A0ABU9TXC4_9GAMM